MKAGNCIAGAVLGWLLAGNALAAPKTDVVVMRNGDRITGEIKGIERGILTFKTDSMGTLSIEWDEVAQIKTDQYLEIEESNGARRYGRLPELTEPGVLTLHPNAGGQGKDTVVRIDQRDAVHVVPLSEGNFFDRIDGHISAGLDAASANDSRQYTLSADATYRDPIRQWTATYDGAWDKSTGNPSQARNAATLEQRRFLGEDWFWSMGGSLATNDELDLHLRTLFGGGFGRYFLRDSQRELSGLFGVVVTREDYVGTPASSNTEGLLQGNYAFFRTSHPELDVSLALTLYPSFTVSGRWRSEASLKARYEIIKDLYYELSYINSRDNKPQTEGASESDWSIISSLGYKF
ncbi:DUF481 domain-containing protein [Pseudoxanthomonas dokdonensis]|uniref:DUF481 domain-containing protein n=1 Tax=Pseudoxanthomonas dokdonensis TaxID=344882 RepID=UPI000AC5C3FD|nr:DUF481 domain-containing protein [Pseudoxanthomonas dokdonensis]